MPTFPANVGRGALKKAFFTSVRATWTTTRAGGTCIEEDTTGVMFIDREQVRQQTQEWHSHQQSRGEPPQSHQQSRESHRNRISSRERATAIASAVAGRAVAVTTAESRYQKQQGKTSQSPSTFPSIHIQPQLTQHARLVCRARAADEDEMEGNGTGDSDRWRLHRGGLGNVEGSWPDSDTSCQAESLADPAYNRSLARRKATGLNAERGRV